MRTPYTTSQESWTPEQIAAWIAAADRKHQHLHHLLAEPLYSTCREQALFQLSDLFKETLEEVRVLSANLQHDSQALCTHARTLREQSTALCERSQSAREARGPAGPSAEAIREAEQPLLDQCKDGLH
jgi:hypothetical protein